jgi:hypothetical protein
VSNRCRTPGGDVETITLQREEYELEWNDVNPNRTRRNLPEKKKYSPLLSRDNRMCANEGGPGFRCHFLGGDAILVL